MGSITNLKLSLRTRNKPLFVTASSRIKPVYKTREQPKELPQTAKDDQKPQWVHPPCKATRVNPKVRVRNYDTLRQTQVRKKNQSCQCTLYDPVSFCPENKSFTFDKTSRLIGERKFSQIAIVKPTFQIQASKYAIPSESDINLLEVSCQTAQPNSHIHMKDLAIEMNHTNWPKRCDKRHELKPEEIIEEDFQVVPEEKVSFEVQRYDNPSDIVLRSRIQNDGTYVSMVKNPGRLLVRSMERGDSREDVLEVTLENISGLGYSKDGVSKCRDTQAIQCIHLNASSFALPVQQITFKMTPKLNCVIGKHIFIPFVPTLTTEKLIPALKDSEHEVTEDFPKKKSFLKKLNDLKTSKKTLKRKEKPKEKPQIEKHVGSEKALQAYIKHSDAQNTYPNSGLFSDNTPPKKKSWCLETNMNALQLIVAQQECINQLKYICEQQLALFSKVQHHEFNSSSKFSSDFKASMNFPTSTPFSQMPKKRKTSDVDAVESLDQRNFNLLDKMCQLVENKQIHVDWRYSNNRPQPK